MDLYEILEIEKGATIDQIKKAHRRLVMLNHPDKGGDKDMFEHIQKAYEVLSDPERRELYDNTGQVDKVKDTFMEEFSMFIYSTLVNGIKSEGVNIDHISLCNQVLEQELKQMSKTKDLNDRQIHRLTKANNKIKKKTEGDGNLISDIIVQEIQNLYNHNEIIDKQINTQERIKDELDKYQYDINPDEFERVFRRGRRYVQR